jgi:hypothetical protein
MKSLFLCGLAAAMCSLNGLPVFEPTFPNGQPKKGGSKWSSKKKAMKKKRLKEQGRIK